MDIYNLYVISVFTQYSNVDMLAQRVYPSIADANAVLDAIDPKDRQNVTYAVQTLDDHIREVYGDAYSSGQADERGIR